MKQNITGFVKIVDFGMEDGEINVRTAGKLVMKY